MPKFLALCLAAAFFAQASSLAAADVSDRWAQYNHLKDDDDAYVGEGIAKLSDFGGDADKALEAARQRARADLGASIRIHVSSVSTESLSQAQGVSSESLQSSSQESSDLNVENVKTREFLDLPLPGKVTVLAYVSKEDYRRQLAGKGVRIYAPEWGLRLDAGVFYPVDSNLPPAGVNNFTLTDADPSSFGLDLVWRDWDLGGDLASSAEQSYILGHVGFDWTPFKTRIQCFLPLRLFLGAKGSASPTIKGSDTMGIVTGCGAGLGLRFWVTDSFALVLENIFTTTLTRGKNDYGTLEDMNGGQASLGVLWSGF